MQMRVLVPVGVVLETRHHGGLRLNRVNRTVLTLPLRERRQRGIAAKADGLSPRPDEPGAESLPSGIIEDGIDGVCVEDTIQPQIDRVQIGVADAVTDGVGQRPKPAIKLA